MVKILYISGIKPIGGIKSFILNYQSNFDQNMIRIDHLYFSDHFSDEFDDEVQKLGSIIYQFPAMKYSRFIQIYSMVDEFFSKHAQEYLAIHMHSPTVGFFCCPLAKKYGIKYHIIHSHSIEYSGKLINSIRNRALCLGLKKQANIYFACSRIAAEFLYGKEYYINGKVKIFNNAIDCNRFRFNFEMRNTLRNNMNLVNKLIIGHVGNFFYPKNHGFIIEVFKNMKTINSNVVLMLIGEGGDEFHLQHIKRKVKSLDLENDVLFLGKKIDVENFMSMMDIFIFPSKFEGLGMVLIEAQAAGMPCFASDNIPKETGVTELIHYISLKESASFWAKEILSSASRVVDKDYTKQLCDAGYDIKVEAKKMENYYLSLE